MRRNAENGFFQLKTSKTQKGPFCKGFKRTYLCFEDLKNTEHFPQNRQFIFSSEGNFLRQCRVLRVDFMDNSAMFQGFPFTVHDMANHESSMEIDDRTICAISTAKDKDCSSQKIPNPSVFISEPSFYLGVLAICQKI